MGTIGRRSGAGVTSPRTMRNPTLAAGAMLALAAATAARTVSVPSATATFRDAIFGGGGADVGADAHEGMAPAA
jgi:hypothetical protein